MEIFYLILIFVLGTVFGSFFSLAIYRIPLKKDITHERSFCPNCNHKLGFWDMIPILSYIFHRGRCKYCNKKIRARYLILEISSGLVFLLKYLSLNFNNILFPYIEIDKLIEFIEFIFMYITLVIIAGIDKEYRNINLKVLLFGIITESITFIYKLFLHRFIDYKFIASLVIIMIFYIIYRKIYSVKGKKIYMFELLMYISYICSCIGNELLFISIIISIIFIIVCQIFDKINYELHDKPNILQENKLPTIKIGFFISIPVILISILESFFKY